MKETLGRYGDYINPAKPDIIEALRNAGLDTITFSLHTYSKVGLQHLTDIARLAGRYRIVPAIQTVMTSQTADKLPGVAAHAAQNGVLFAFGIVQTRGDSFARQQDISVIPTQEQQEKTLRALSVLKMFGFIRNSRNYLADVETGIRVEDIVTLDSDEWREQKRLGVSNCGNCLYSCYYEAQNPDILGDVYRYRKKQD